MNEKDVLDLNKLEAKKDFVELDKKLRALTDEGVSIVNVWNEVDEFRTLNGFKKRIKNKIFSNRFQDALDLATEIVELRQKKKELVRSRNYAEAKEVSDKAWKKMLGLYLFLRKGSKDTFSQIGEKHLDILQPFPDGML